MVVAKEIDVIEHMIHTGGEQIQGNETRNFRDRGPRIGEKGGGGASWTAQALFAWTRTHDEPRKSGTYGYIAAGLLRAALTCLLCIALMCHPGTARLRGSGLLAPRHRMATVPCSMSDSVYSHVARKRKFSTFSLRSAVENGSFSGQIYACFDSYPGVTGSQNILSTLHRGQPCPSTHAPTHRASTRTASRWPLLCRSGSIVIRRAWTFV